MNLKLGINLGFASNKYPEPHVWTRIVAEELGLKYVQFVVDLLNPYLDEEIVKEQTYLINENTAKYGIKVSSTFLSSYTRVNHLMHPDAKQREWWARWFRRYADLSAELGATMMGGHLGILTFEDFGSRRAFIVEEGLKQWRELSAYAKDKGMECLIFEPMSVPRELANTVEETKDLLARLNEGSAIPFKLCLDIGHAPHPDDRDPYRWLRELGSVSPIIHIQQTEKDHSRHWPFTEACNEKGIIDGAKVIEALRQSGATEAELIFEIYHREAWPSDFEIVADHQASVRYWRQFVPN